MEVQMMFVLLVSVICLSKVSPSVGQVVTGGRSGGGDRRPSDPGRVDTNGGESYMDRYGPGSQPSSPTRDRYNSGPSRSHSLPSGSTGDRYNPGPSRSNSLPNGRYDDDRDRYDTNRDRYDTNSDRYDTNRDRYDTNRDRYDDNSDRYDTNRDRYDDNRDRYDDNRDRYDDNRDRYDNTGPNRGPNTRPGPDTGDRYNPRPGPETEGPQKPRNCPNTLDQWESSMNRCLSPLTSLPRRSSIVDKCKAYRAAEPCVDGLQLCKRDHPRIDYYKSKAIDTWRDMEREAEIYGVCHNIRGRDLGM